MISYNYFTNNFYELIRPLISEREGIIPRQAASRFFRQFRSRISQGWMVIPSSHVSANNYRLENSSSEPEQESAQKYQEYIYIREHAKREEKKRSSRRRQSVISLVIDHRMTHRDWPYSRGCTRSATRPIGPGRV